MATIDFSQFHQLFIQGNRKPEWIQSIHELENVPSSIEISSDGRSIAVGDTIGGLTILRISEKKHLIESTGFHRRHTPRISDVVFNTTTDIIATCSSECKIKLSSFDPNISEIGERNVEVTMSDRVRALHFMEDLGNHSSILFSAVGRLICLTDCFSSTTFRHLKGHSGNVTSFCSWGGCMIASSSVDRTVRLWDVRVKEAVKIFEPLSKSSGVNAFSVDGCGRILVRGDGEGNVHAFDVVSGKKITTKRILISPICFIRIASQTRFTVVADEMSANICDLRDPLLISNVSPLPLIKTEGRTISARWLPNEPSFLTVSSSKALRFWELNDVSEDSQQSKSSD